MRDDFISFLKFCHFRKVLSEGTTSRDIIKTLIRRENRAGRMNK